MNYLEKVLGIKITYLPGNFNYYPNFIVSRYKLQNAILNDKRVIFIYFKDKCNAIEILKKHLKKIEKTEKLPLILIMNEITYRQKEYLIRERISFIVENKQIYLPFMAVYLQEKCNGEKQTYKKLLPSAQILFLYFIYHGGKKINTSQAAKDLSLTPMSVSRASRQLEEMNILQLRKEGVNKILFSDFLPKELFEKNRHLLVNPVKRKIYISKDLIKENLLLSGYSALAKYSLLNAPEINNYASSSISKWNKYLTNTLYDSATQAEIEFWRYDPKKLSSDNTVDVLSLALSLSDDSDERVEMSVEEMLKNLWSTLNGNRYR